MRCDVRVLQELGKLTLAALGVLCVVFLAASLILGAITIVAAVSMDSSITCGEQ